MEKALEILKSRRPDVELVVLSGEPPERVPLYMNACDALVLASDKEGSPQVIKEAMACNLPIVSTPVGDVSEVITGTEGCHLCTQDPEDIALKPGMALDGGCRTNGRENVIHMAMHSIADRIIEVYEEVTKLRRPAESVPIPVD